MELQRGNLISIHFDSVIDFDDVNMFGNPNTDHFNSTLNRRNDGVWFGPTIIDSKDALDKAAIGDHKLYDDHLRNKIDELDRRLELPGFENINVVPVIKRRRIKKAFGDELDIQQVYQGNLERAWTTTERVEFDQEHHLVTILIDIGGNCDIHATNTLWVAASCLKVCTDLEKAGKSVQVIVGGVGTNATTSRENLSITYCVKKYNEALNIERLAAMSHIGFFRSCGFLGMLTCSNKLTKSLGHSASMRTYTPINLQDEINSGKTKLIFLDRSLSATSALSSIKDAYSQMVEKESCNE